MRLIAVGTEPVGIISIGAFARGGIAIGQGAVGIVAVGQLSTGVFTVGQLSIGLVTLAQLGFAPGYLMAQGGLGGYDAKGMAVAKLRPHAGDAPWVLALKGIAFFLVCVLFFTVALRPLYHIFFPHHDILPKTLR